MDEINLLNSTIRTLLNYYSKTELLKIQQIPFYLFDNVSEKSIKHLLKQLYEFGIIYYDNKTWFFNFPTFCMCPINIFVIVPKEYLIDTDFFINLIDNPKQFLINLIYAYFEYSFFKK